MGTCKLLITKITVCYNREGTNTDSRFTWKMPGIAFRLYNVFLTQGPGRHTKTTFTPWKFGIRLIALYLFQWKSDANPLLRKHSRQHTQYHRASKTNEMLLKSKILKDRYLLAEMLCVPWTEGPWTEVVQGSRPPDFGMGVLGVALKSFNTKDVMLHDVTTLICLQLTR